MDKGKISEAAAVNSPATTTTHHLNKPPAGLTENEFNKLRPLVSEFHTYEITNDRQCSSLLAQRIKSPVNIVWSVLRQFEKPQAYKHFIKSCSVKEDFVLSVGSTREVEVISGLPAETSIERLDLLDDERRVTGFSITGGDHRLRNYHSVMTVHEEEEGTVVMESYVVDVPEGNSEEDTRLFADTVVRLNLLKLTYVTQTMARDLGENRG
ncbi:abscisic acid receptor PYL1-like [Impatiens glandulifera]|uniref:abscisic acid receptor PYL1-like n=1 Tax=Impatiens glandulifera TaxID=253017 RepID=UPI001FB16283|nr:abscisic acid receptor PYL1-like [Impatiens glandulifera]